MERLREGVLAGVAGFPEEQGCGAGDRQILGSSLRSCRAGEQDRDEEEKHQSLNEPGSNFRFPVF